MKKALFFVCSVLLVCMVRAQGVPRKGGEQVIPLRAENWNFRPGAVTFTEGTGGPVMNIVGAGYVVVKNVDFADGTIEFDDQPMDERFASFMFHWQDSTENEVFYFRTARGIGHPDARDGIQYTPVIKGINCWNIMDHYQTHATFGQKAPNHVKLVISGKQMRVYVNSQAMTGGAAGAGAGGGLRGDAGGQVWPTLEVPRLEGNTTHGTLAFSGKAMISHLVIRPGQTEGLLPMEGLDPTGGDTRYIRHWQVTAADSIPDLLDIGRGIMPGKQTSWSPVVAERLGLVNLTRLYGGKVPGAKTRHQIAWLRTTIHAEAARSVQLRLGFVEEVWMFLNGQWLYVDKNFFRNPIAKVPDGRLSLENATISMPLKQGDNELLIGVGANFSAWGIMARLDDMEGITLDAGK